VAQRRRLGLEVANPAGKASSLMLPRSNAAM
jgi:hypothetical protein